MAAILFIVTLHTHWFSADTHTITTQEFSSMETCMQVKEQLNLEFSIIDTNMHAECAKK